MREQFKRFLSLFLAAAMCFGMLPQSVFAEELAETVPGETAAQETVTPETVAQETVTTETVAQETVTTETVAQETETPEPVSYTLSVRGGSAEPAQPQAGDTVTLTHRPEDSHELFSCWMVNGSPIEGSSFVMPQENVTADAVFAPAWNVTVEGGRAEPAKVVCGQSVTVTPSGEGTFLRWISTSLSEEEKTQAPLTFVPYEDTDLKAVYDTTKIPPVITVTLRVENGTWYDGGTYDRKIRLSTDGKPVSLSEEEIPYGMVPVEGFQSGSWDKDPAQPLIQDTVFTYTFRTQAPEQRRIIHVQWDYGYDRLSFNPPEDAGELFVSLTEQGTVVCTQALMLQEGWMEMTVPAGSEPDGAAFTVPEGFSVEVREDAVENYSAVFTLDAPEKAYTLGLDPRIVPIAEEVVCQVLAGSSLYPEGDSADGQVLSLNRENQYCAAFSVHRYTRQGRVLTPIFVPEPWQEDFPLELQEIGADSLELTYGAQAGEVSAAASASFAEDDWGTLQEIPVTVERAVSGTDSYSVFAQVLLTRENGWNVGFALPAAGISGQWDYRLTAETPRGFTAEGPLSVQGTELNLSFRAIEEDRKTLPLHIAFLTADGSPMAWPTDRLQILLEPWQKPVTVEAPVGSAMKVMEIPGNTQNLTASLEGYTFFASFDDRQQAWSLTGIPNRQIRLNVSCLDGEGHPASWPAGLESLTVPVVLENGSAVQVSVTAEACRNVQVSLPALPLDRRGHITIDDSQISAAGYSVRSHEAVEDPGCFEIVLRENTKLTLNLQFTDEQSQNIWLDPANPSDPQAMDMDLPIVVGRQGADSLTVYFSPETRGEWSFAEGIWSRTLELDSFFPPVSGHAEPGKGWTATAEKTGKPGSLQYDIQVQKVPEGAYGSTTVTSLWNYGYGDETVRDCRTMARDVIVDYVSADRLGEENPRWQSFTLTSDNNQKILSYQILDPRQPGFTPQCLRPRPVEGFEITVSGTEEEGFVIHYTAKPEAYQVKPAPGVRIPGEVDAIDVKLVSGGIHTENGQEPPAVFHLTRENGFSLSMDLPSYNQKGQPRNLIAHVENNPLFEVQVSPSAPREFLLTFSGDRSRKALAAGLTWLREDGTVLPDTIVPLDQFPVEIQCTVEGEQPVAVETLVLKKENGWRSSALLPSADPQGRPCTYQLVPAAAPQDYVLTTGENTGSQLNLELQYTPEMKKVPLYVDFQDENSVLMAWPADSVTVKIRRSTVAATLACEAIVEKPAQGMTGKCEISLPIREPDGREAHYLASVEPMYVGYDQFASDVLRADDFHLTLRKSVRVEVNVRFKDENLEPIQPPADLDKVEILLPCSGGKDLICTVRRWNQWQRFLYCPAFSQPVGVEPITQLEGFAADWENVTDSGKPGVQIFNIDYIRFADLKTLTVRTLWQYSEDSAPVEQLPPNLDPAQVAVLCNGEKYNSMWFNRSDPQNSGNVLSMKVLDNDQLSYVLRPDSIPGFESPWEVKPVEKEDGSLEAEILYKQIPTSLMVAMEPGTSILIPESFPEIPVILENRAREGAAPIVLTMNRENGWVAETEDLMFYTLNDLQQVEENHYVPRLEPWFQDRFEIFNQGAHNTYYVRYRGGIDNGFGLKASVRWLDFFGRPLKNGPANVSSIPAQVLYSSTGSNGWQSYFHTDISDLSWSSTNFAFREDYTGTPVQYKLQLQVPEHFRIVEEKVGKESLTTVLQFTSETVDRTVTVKWEDSQGNLLDWPVDSARIPVNPGDGSDNVILLVQKPGSGKIGSAEISLPAISMDGSAAACTLADGDLINVGGCSYRMEARDMEMTLRLQDSVAGEISWVDDLGRPMDWPVEQITLQADGSSLTVERPAEGQQGGFLLPSSAENVSAQVPGFTVCASRENGKWILTGYQDLTLFVDAQWQDVLGNPVQWPKKFKGNLITLPVVSRGTFIGRTGISAGNMEGYQMTIPAVHQDTGEAVDPSLEIEGKWIKGYFLSTYRDGTVPNLLHLVLRETAVHKLHLRMEDLEGYPIWDESGELIVERFPGITIHVQMTDGSTLTLPFTYEDLSGWVFEPETGWTIEFSGPNSDAPASVEVQPCENWIFTARTCQKPAGAGADIYLGGRQAESQRVGSTRVRVLFDYSCGQGQAQPISRLPGMVQVDYVNRNVTFSTPLLQSMVFNSQTGNESVLQFEIPADGETVYTKDSFMPHEMPGFVSQVTGSQQEGFTVLYTAVPEPYTVRLAEGILQPDGELQVLLKPSAPVGGEKTLFILNGENGYSAQMNLRSYTREGEPVSYEAQMTGSAADSYRCTAQTDNQPKVFLVSLNAQVPQVTLTAHASWFWEDGSDLTDYLMGKVDLQVLVERTVNGTDYEQAAVIMLDGFNDWTGALQLPSQDAQGNDYDFRMRVDPDAVPVDYVLQEDASQKMFYEARMIYQPEKGKFPISLSFMDWQGHLLPWPQESVPLWISVLTIDEEFVLGAEMPAPSKGERIGHYWADLPLREPDGTTSHYVAHVGEIEGYSVPEPVADDFKLLARKNIQMGLEVSWLDPQGNAIAAPDDIMNLDFLLSLENNQDTIIYLEGYGDVWNQSIELDGDKIPKDIQLVTQVPGFVCTWKRVPGRDGMDMIFQVTLQQEEKVQQLTVKTQWQMEKDGPFTDKLPKAVDSVVLDVYQDGSFYQTVWIDRGNEEHAKPRLPEDTVLSVPAEGPKGPRTYSVVPRHVLGFACPQSLPVQALEEDGKLTATVRYTQVPDRIQVRLDDAARAMMPTDFSMEIPVSVVNEDDTLLGRLVLNQQGDWSAQMETMLYTSDGEYAGSRLFPKAVVDLGDTSRLFMAMPMNEEGIIYICCLANIYQRELTAHAVWQDEAGNAVDPPAWAEPLAVEVLRQMPGQQDWEPFSQISLRTPGWAEDLQVPAMPVTGGRFDYKMVVTAPAPFDAQVTETTEDDFHIVFVRRPNEKKETVEVLFRDCYGRKIPWPVDQVKLNLRNSGDASSVEVAVAKNPEDMTGSETLTVKAFDQQYNPISYSLEQPNQLVVDGITYVPQVEGLQVMYTAKARVTVKVQWKNADGTDCRQIPADPLTVNLTYRDGSEKMILSSENQWQAMASVPGRSAPYGVEAPAVKGFRSTVSDPVRNDSSDYIYVVTYTSDSKMGLIHVDLRWIYEKGLATGIMPEDVAGVRVTLYRREGKLSIPVITKSVAGQADFEVLMEKDGKPVLYEAGVQKLEGFGKARIQGFGPAVMTLTEESGFTVTYTQENVPLRGQLDRKLVAMETASVEVTVKVNGREDPDLSLVLNQENNWQDQVPGGVPLYGPDGSRNHYEAEVKNPDFSVSGSRKEGFTVDRVVPNATRELKVSAVFKDHSGKVMDAPSLCWFLNVMVQGSEGGSRLWETEEKLLKSENWEKTLTVPVNGPDGNGLSYDARLTGIAPRGFTVSVSGQDTDHLVITLQQAKPGWIPRTGDQNHPGIWAAVAGASLIALIAVGAVAYRRKKKK